MAEVDLNMVFGKPCLSSEETVTFFSAACLAGSGSFFHLADKLSIPFAVKIFVDALDREILLQAG